MRETGTGEKGYRGVREEEKETEEEYTENEKKGWRINVKII
jgi:hypothetical protein